MYLVHMNYTDQIQYTYLGNQGATNADDNVTYLQVHMWAVVTINVGLIQTCPNNVFCTIETNQILYIHVHVSQHTTLPLCPAVTSEIIHTTA